MRRVIIESPYKGNIKENIAYAKKAMLHSLWLKEAPIASHLLYTQPGLLDDTVMRQRTLGIEAGLAWLQSCDLMAVYIDLGLSSGMENAVNKASAAGVQVEFRRIVDWMHKISAEELFGGTSI